jgi:hypothetical protein
MNIPPQSPTSINTTLYPTEFQQVIREKSQNFVGREFVFSAINEFLHRGEANRGYFTLVGAPGSGKSAILAHYATQNPPIAYYNAQIAGKNQADQFLATICTQLIHHYPQLGIAVPPNPDATEGSWFLSLLLQKISDRLEPHQQLILAIDALEECDRHSQPPGSNLFYLPRYLPENVYFLLTRRPFAKEKSGLLIETPSQILNLGDYPQQNREDVQLYLQCLTPHEPEGTEAELGDRTSPSKTAAALKSWLTTHHLSQPDFIAQLTAKSENNFMYLSQILVAIAQGFYPEPFQFHRLPPTLQAYYQQHLQKMIPFAKLTSPLFTAEIQEEQSNAIAVLQVLVQQNQPTSVEFIASQIEQDEYEVEKVLENWIEFLHQEKIAGQICYSLYHSSFRNWLRSLKG